MVGNDNESDCDEKDGSYDDVREDTVMAKSLYTKGIF